MGFFSREEQLEGDKVIERHRLLDKYLSVSEHYAFYDDGDYLSIDDMEYFYQKGYVLISGNDYNIDYWFKKI